MTRETFSRLTVDPGVDTYPVWIRDGTRVVTGSSRKGSARNLISMPADGSSAEKRLTTSENEQIPLDVSPDGKYVLFNESGDLGLVSLEEDEDAKLILQGESYQRNAMFSPNGAFLVYQSDEYGDAEIYVRPFPNIHDGRFRISQDGRTLATVGAKRS